VTDNSTDQPTEVVPDPAAPPDRQTIPVKGSGLRPVAEQLAKVLDSIGSLEPIQQPLLDAQGLLLAEEIIAESPLPSFDNSAMDGRPQAGHGRQAGCASGRR